MSDDQWAFGVHLRDGVVPHHLPRERTLVLGVPEWTWDLVDVVQEDGLTIQSGRNATVNAKDLAVDHGGDGHVVKGRVDLLPHLLTQRMAELFQTLAETRQMTMR